ncbi:hypothetical protein [Roseovarius aestuarii]|nr:hypothetical protein [Roseovarius aestuarii]
MRQLRIPNFVICIFCAICLSGHARASNPDLQPLSEMLKGEVEIATWYEVFKRCSALHIAMQKDTRNLGLSEADEAKIRKRYQKDISLWREQTGKISVKAKSKDSEEQISQSIFELSETYLKLFEQNRSEMGKSLNGLAAEDFTYCLQLQSRW